MRTNDLSRKVNLTFMAAMIATVLTLGTTSCNQVSQEKQMETVVQSPAVASITEQEVSDAQKAWGEGIVKIGKVYLEKGDYKTAALHFINEYYDYSQGTVLFKPTLVSQKQFRTDLQGALSYFVAANGNYPEDHGFAIKPWSSVRWENIGTKIIGNMAVAMGNYYFTPVDGGNEVKVEYSFAYTRDNNGKLKIILHDSHLPYSPVETH